MHHKRSIDSLLESLSQEAEKIKSITPQEKRKVWKQTETEEDYIQRSGVGAHNRAVAALMWRDPRLRKSFRELEQQGITVSDDDLLGFKNRHIDRDSTLYKFNVSPDDIDEALLVSNWRRLKVRQLWQDAVYSNLERKAFWEDSSRIRCIHHLEYFNLDGSQNTGTIESGLEKLKRFIVYSMNGPANAELSCTGHWRPKMENFEPITPIGVEITKRKIVWACDGDAWTQFLSSADDNIRNYFQIRKEIEDEDNPLAQKIFDAALVKFPSRIDPSDVLFSERDVKNTQSAIISEIIIADYEITPDSCIIIVKKSEARGIKDEITEKIQSIAKEYFGENSEFLIDFV